MATFLDVTGLEHFSSLFVFLFTWLIMYAVFSTTKILGGNKALPILLGLVLSIFVLLSPAVTSIVRELAPWITVGFLFIVLVAVVSKLMVGDFPGAGQASIEVRAVLLVFLVIVIFIASMTQIRKHISVPGDEGTSEDTEEFLKPTTIIFHPKVMGAILLLAIAIFTIALLASRVY